jgi:hypothetical protein
VAELGRHRGKGKELTGRAHVLAREEREDESGEKNNSMEKAYFEECANMHLGQVRGGSLWRKVDRRGDDWAGSQEKIQMEIDF